MVSGDLPGKAALIVRVHEVHPAEAADLPDDLPLYQDRFAAYGSLVALRGAGLQGRCHENLRPGASALQGLHCPAQRAPQAPSGEGSVFLFAYLLRVVLQGDGALLPPVPGSVIGGYGDVDHPGAAPLALCRLQQAPHLVGQYVLRREFIGQILQTAGRQCLLPVMPVGACGPAEGKIAQKLHAQLPAHHGSDSRHLLACDAVPQTGIQHALFFSHVPSVPAPVPSVRYPRNRFRQAYSS